MAKVQLYGLFFGVLLCGCLMRVTAQNHYLRIQCNDSSMQQLQLATKFNNKLQCKTYINQLPSLLQSKGYLAASVDSFYQDSATSTIQLFLGDKYLWQSLTILPQQQTLLEQLGIKKEAFITKPINQQSIVQLQEKLLDYFDNSGYPFAKIGFDSVQIVSGKVQAQLAVNKGVEYKFDSLHVLGNAKISSQFLYRYLNLQPGEAFNKEKLNTINQRLLELPYLQQSNDWNLNMLATSYSINLYLQPKRSNQINVLIGFLPANQQLGGKLLLTGEANLNLKNAFGTGETILFNWQQLQSASPRLNLGFQKPYIFNSKFGIDFGFEMYKKDTDFLNLIAKLGLQYLLSAKQSGKIALETFKTNLLIVDTATVIITKKLPDIIDVSTTNLALEYELNNTNYRFNPRSGNEFKIGISAGNKTIKANNTITQLKSSGFNYSSLYDTIEKNTYQLKVKTSFAHYFPTSKQSVIKTVINAGWYESPNYFRNELFQLGGYKLLRGFDEESIFANRYAVGTLEYRYLIGINSYFNGFIDLGAVNNKVTNTRNSYIGAGVGLAFETKQGIINISFAAGKRNDLPFNFRESKIHLGFVSIF
ncbi:MAG: BamA/TamA family outer membrane protein [Flavobacterium sp.]|nr:BamA/TamA family outer membrane protein [Flavobacterium sp.]